MILLKWVWRALRAVLLALAALVLLIEELGWRPLSRWLARWAHWPPLARLEARIRKLRPYAALSFFAVPMLTLFPLKLLALWLIHRGQTAIGIAVIVLAKVVGTALAGRLFVLTESQLRQFSWFNSALNWWLGTKARLRQLLKNSSVWRAARRFGKQVSMRLRR